MAVRLWEDLREVFAGSDNLIHRRLNGKALAAFLKTLPRRFPIIQQACPVFNGRQSNVFDEIRRFLNNHMYTSAPALKNYFPRHFDALVLKYNSKLSSGRELPGRDMPGTCRFAVLHDIIAIAEADAFNCLFTVNESALEKEDILEAGEFEMSTKNRVEFLWKDKEDHREVYNYLQARDGSAFDPKKFHSTTFILAEI